MAQSIIELSEQRGIEQGIEQGKQQGIAQGRQQGIEQGKQQGIAQGIAQGRQQGARETTIENTLAILTARFPHADVNALKPTLEAIVDLEHLKQLNLNASLAQSFQEFQHRLEG